MTSYARTSVFGALVVIGAVIAAPVPAVAQERISVYVHTPQAAGRSVDQTTKRRIEAANRLRDYLHKKKTIAIVDSKEAADVVVQLVFAGPAPGDTFQIKPNISGQGVTGEHATEFKALARLTFNDDSFPIDRQSVSQNLAVRLVADDVEKWVRNNRDRVLESRKQRKQPPTFRISGFRPHTSAFQSGTTIDPGTGNLKSSSPAPRS